MRNNQDRFAAPGTPKAPEPPSEASNSLFDFARPTEFVDLPTKGLFYPEGHPLNNKKTLEIRYMTAKDEDILTSKTLLQNGVALDRFLAGIIVDKNINIDTLLSADKNALMVAARITGFGANYSTKISCPACNKTSEYDFDLNHVKPYYGAEDVQATPQGTFFVDLPSTSVRAEFKILSAKEESNLLKLAENKRKRKMQESTLTDQLKAILVTLNGETERSLINRFVDVMPAADSRFLRKEYKRLVPGVDMKHDFTCPSCSHEQEVQIPLTVDFFWSNR